MVLSIEERIEARSFPIFLIGNPFQEELDYSEAEKINRLIMRLIGIRKSKKTPILFSVTSLSPCKTKKWLMKGKLLYKIRAG